MDNNENKEKNEGTQKILLPDDFRVLTEINEFLDKETKRTKDIAKKLSAEDLKALDDIIVYVEESNAEVKAQKNKLKYKIFDSMEEEIFYKEFKKVIDLERYNVDIHVPLCNIFINPYENKEINQYKFKLKNQHCDFLIRDKTNLKVIFGIEIDGNQHKTDFKQKLNDLYKNKTFEINNIPLVRIAASDVRSNKWEQVLKLNYYSIYQKVHN